MDDDLPFLAELYASTRRAEVDPLPWTAEEKEGFLRWQFESQHRHYLEYYPGCERLVVERPIGGATSAATAPVGRLYVDRWPDQIRLVDIALLPEHRGRGLGSALLETILAEGRRRSLPVTIHVEANNPALRLYRRLGFRHVDDNGVYQLLEWRPEGAPPAAAAAASP